jgi:hypothetical protein
MAAAGTRSFDPEDSSVLLPWDEPSDERPPPHDDVISLKQGSGSDAMTRGWMVWCHECDEGHYGCGAQYARVGVDHGHDHDHDHATACHD